MYDYFVVAAFSFSIFMAAIAGIVKIRRVDRAYYPFIMLACIASLNEVISYLSAKYFQTNAINSNLYLLVEALLITFQFYRWNNFEGKKKLYCFIQLCIVGIWLAENYNIHGLLIFNLRFRIFSAFLFVVMSIHMNARLIVHYRKQLYKHPIYLICSGLIIFFTIEILIDCFWTYATNDHPLFQISVFYILMWTNLFVNLIFALAIICIPPKPRYIMLY